MVGVGLDFISLVTTKMGVLIIADFCVSQSMAERPFKLGK